MGRIKLEPINQNRLAGEDPVGGSFFCAGWV